MHLDDGQIKLWAAILALGNTLIQLVSSKKVRRVSVFLFKKAISVPRGILTALKNDYRVVYIWHVLLKQILPSTSHPLPRNIAFKKEHESGLDRIWVIPGNHDTDLRSPEILFFSGHGLKKTC
jgi:hypothetical protein